jgi:hypothetical protein
MKVAIDASIVCAGVHESSLRNQLEESRLLAMNCEYVAALDSIEIILAAYPDNLDALRLKGNVLEQKALDENWLTAARAHMRAVVPAAEVLVLQYECALGRIGFDCNGTAQLLFRWIIGTGISWNIRERSVAEYTSGSPTEYVVDLFRAGFPVPVTGTLSNAKPTDGLAIGLQQLAEAKPDEDEGRFASLIASVALACERACVHSVAQWETVVLTRHPGAFVEGLRAKSAEANVHFDQVADQSLLPRW